MWVERTARSRSLVLEVRQESGRADGLCAEQFGFGVAFAPVFPIPTFFRETNMIQKPNLANVSLLSVSLKYLSLVSIMLGLSFALLYQAKHVAPMHEHTYATFQRLAGLEKSSVIYNAWSPRIASIEISYRFAQIVDAFFRSTNSALPLRKHVEYAVALWTAGWFAAMCVVCILAFQWRSLFYMLGIFAGISFGYTPLLDFRIYSWDMPALFAYVVAVALLAKIRTTLITLVCLSAVIVFAMPFKETSIVLCIFPLFVCTQYGIRRRIALTITIALAAIFLKLTANYYVTGSVFSFATRSFHDNDILLIWNIKLFFTEPIVLVNAGTLLAMLLSPLWQRKVLMYKAMALIFIASNFLFGVANEYRIWFEMLPLSLFVLDATMTGD